MCLDSRLMVDIFNDHSQTKDTFMDPDGYLLNKQSVNQQNETNKNFYKKLLDQH